MNKRGFTLVELLAVIALVAILSSLAVVNVLSSVNNSRKNAYLLDAKRMVSKAEYLIASRIEDRNIVNSGEIIKYSYSQLNEKGEFLKDSDGNPFDENTFVIVSKDNNSYAYCICVKSPKKKIMIEGAEDCNSESNCISSNNLTTIDVVKDINN